MRAVARAHQNRDLADFEKALRDYREGALSRLSPFLTDLSLTVNIDFGGSTELSSDPTIRSHLAALYDTLLEQNLLRIVEPYSVVEIEYVAQRVGQGRQDVEAKWVSDFASLSLGRGTDICCIVARSVWRWQVVANDPRQSLPRCARSRPRMPSRL